MSEEMSAAVPTTPNAPGASSQESEPKQQTAKPTPSEIEYEELVVNGKSHKVTREEMKRRAQLGWSATEKFESASAKEKKVQKILENAKTNPIGMLTDPELGLTKDQIKDAFEKWYHKEFIEPEGLTEEQLEARRAKEELKKYKEQERIAKEQQEKEAEEKMTATQRTEMERSLIKAIEENKLPKTKFTVGRMAFYLGQAIKSGVEVPMDLIAQKVQQEKQDIIGELLHTQDIEAAIQILGEDFINKVRQYDLKRLREKRQGVAAPVVSAPQAAPKDHMGYEDVSKNLKLMRMGKMTF